MTITVLCPTRGRPRLLERSIRSLMDKARPMIPDVQVLLACDADDPETVAVAESMADSMTVTERKGYARLHEYVNGLLSLADGEWLMLWNDDAVMESPGWARAVEEEPAYGVLDPATNHPPQHDGLMTFPIVHRSLVDTLGFFSRSAHCDTYVQYIADGLGIRRPFPAVRIFHDRPDITGRAPDRTHDERPLWESTPAFYADDMQAAIQADIARLREAGLGAEV